jgi:hypothetical protein
VSTREAQIDALGDDAPKLAFRSVAGNERAIGGRLKTIVDDPVNLDQRDYPICGANAFLHSVAVRQPEEYVAYVLKLIERGSADIRALHVDSPESVKGKKRLPVQPPGAGAPGRRIDIASWVAMASLRASENTFLYKSVARMGGKRGPGLWHAGIKGMSSTKEVAGWFTKAGYTDVDFTDNTVKAYLVGSSAVDANKLVELGGKFPEHEIVLAVNSGQIDVDNPSQRPTTKGADHFLRLASKVAERGDFAYFRVWSWGAVKEMKVKKEDVPRVVYGYVVAKPPQDEVAAPRGGAP